MSDSKYITLKCTILLLYKNRYRIIQIQPCMSVCSEICNCLLEITAILNEYCYILFHYIFTAGFDYKGGHFTARFTKDSTEAAVGIPIIEDFNTNEGLEYFSVQLSLQSREIFSDLPYVIHARLGDQFHAEVNILEDIILTFQDESAEVIEGENLILNITASAGRKQNSSFTVNITGENQDSQCKFIEGSEHCMYIDSGGRR